MFTKLKNEFAQAKFEGDSRKAKNRTEKTKKNGEKNDFEKTEVQKKRGKRRKGGKVPQVMEGGGVQVGTLKGQGGANRAR